MIKYIFRRLYQSLFILLGVMLLTFLLFRFSAGDAALVLLGKNPTPHELELMREKLGSNKPLLFGYDCKTEAFSAKVTDSAIIFMRQFSTQNRVKLIASFENPKDDCSYTVQPHENQWVLSLKTKSPYRGFAQFQEQSNPFNSQLFDTFRELVDVKSTFPYLTFFNFGNSLTRQEPVRDILLRGVGPSLALMIPIFLGELFIGIGLALIAARYMNRLPDYLIMLSAIVGMSISYLAFILFGQYVLAYQMRLFPVWGFESPYYLLLPIVIGILSGLGGGVRFYRTVFVNELNQEYLRTAKAKGASTFYIYINHLLPNALIPIISRISVTLPFLFTGSLLLEKFFGIPGLGFAGISALAESDLQLLKAIVVLSTLLFVVVNLLTDLLYALVDPRIRLK